MGLSDISLKGEVVVFGSTYMSHFPLYELINKSRLESAVYNRSIEGLTVAEALEILDDCILPMRPHKLFLALGEEDEGDPDALRYYRTIVSRIRTALPDCALFLIALQGESAYADAFNRQIVSLCDGKHVRWIRFVSPAVSEKALYRARFKQMSCFFRNRPPVMPEIFAMAELS